MLSDLFLGIGLSILLGALIGAQRESRQQKGKFRDFAGFRTFTLISLFGFIVGFISFDLLNSYFLIFIAFFGIFLLVTSAFILHYLGGKGKRKESITGEVSFILTFLIGIIISLKYYYIPVMLAIMITTILFLGTKLHNFARLVKENEIFATLKFGIISLVILPILPNKDFGFLDVPLLNTFLLKFFTFDVLSEFTIFNFFQIWLMVVLVSAITYVGYILMKTIGASKGIALTGFLGGLMSSTATTSSFAIESKKFPKLVLPLVIGTIIASSTMFFRILLEVSLVNPFLLNQVILLLFVGVLGFAFAFYFYLKSSENHVKSIEITSPFMILPALKFALFFIVVIFCSKFFTILFGDYGIYFIAFFSGFVDVDVIVLSFSKMALDGFISKEAATIGIFIAAFSNTMFKAGIAYVLGARFFSKRIMLVFSTLTLVGLLLLFIF